jgi:DNA (cytosine-5)-methyltransferase 1
VQPHLVPVEEVDILLAGPPCQGHSNLNNRTRRTDKRNLLYLTAPAMAVACRAKLCIIENVPDVLRDAHRVVETARALLIKSGYAIDEAILSAVDFGVPQSRKRHFLIAVRTDQAELDLRSVTEAFRMPATTLKHAISDLKNSTGVDWFHSPATLSAENKRRIDWLFDHGKYDLPDRHRPDCHKGGHTYPSVYGRMHWDEPAQTITTGFLTPGRGRYIHPSRRRTITPHEAARIQSFPDGYAFDLSPQPTSRNMLAQVIGDAVPPLMALGIGLTGLTLLEALKP